MHNLSQSPLADCGVGHKLWVPWSSSVPLREPRSSFIQQILRDTNYHQFTGNLYSHRGAADEEGLELELQCLISLMRAKGLIYHCTWNPLFLRCNSRAFRSLFFSFLNILLWFRDVYFSGPCVFGSFSLCAAPVLGVSFWLWVFRRHPNSEMCF